MGYTESAQPEETKGLSPLQYPSYPKSIDVFRTDLTIHLTLRA